MVAAVAGALSAAAQAGPTWEEIPAGDAGSTPGGAQAVVGVPSINRIKGNTSVALAKSDFEDMYLLIINDPAGFHASTALFTGQASFNTTLSLFTATAHGLLANDDTGPGLFGSTILPSATDGSGAQISSPGFYYLAVSGSTDNALSPDGLVFLEGNVNEISGPDGQGGLLPMTGWTGEGQTGHYEIALAGVQALPAMENDQCFNARCVLPGATFAHNFGATQDLLAPCAPPGMQKDVWFIYTPTVPAIIQIDTCGSTFDTVLSVQRVCGGALIACNNDAPPGICPNSPLVSRLLVQGQPGVPLLIRVAGINGAVGGIQLNIFGGAGQCLEGCAEDLFPVGNGDGVVGPGDLGQLLSTWGPCPGCPEDLAPIGAPDGVVGPGDLGQLLSKWGPCPLNACGPGAGNCCVPHASPGCNDLSCCSAVCDFDPFCCDTQWDNICVSEAQKLCGGLCTGGGPANDQCANAQPVGNGTIAFSTVGATTDGPPEQLCDFAGNNQVSQDVWFCYTAPCSGAVTVDLCQSSFDTKVAIYAPLTSCICPTSPSAIACNDDFCGGNGLQSRVTFVASPGDQYLFRVGGFGPAVGDVVMTVSCDSACCVGQAGPGCGDPRCESCVCAIDPFCCEVLWDNICASEAAKQCNAACGCL
jgi:hypothetical protein